MPSSDYSSSLSWEARHASVIHDGGLLHFRDTGQPGSTNRTVLMVHGFPQCACEWRLLANELGPDLRCIAPDLRGMGSSFKPANGYDAAHQAGDLLAMLDAAQVQQVDVVAHDLGGLPSLMLAALHPERVRSLALFEVPFLGFSGPGVIDVVNAYYHMKFHQDMDLAQGLIAGRERFYLQHFFNDFSYRKGWLSEAELDHYTSNLQAPGGLRGALEHYRALPVSAEQLAGLRQHRLTMPVLAYGAELALAEHCVNAVREVADDVRGGVVPECGHWVPDERPQWVAGQLHEFWRQHAA